MFVEGKAADGKTDVAAGQRKGDEDGDQFVSDDVTGTVKAGETKPDPDPTSFTKITFTMAGTYVYTITEREGNEPGMEYDPTAWYLVVYVEDTDNQLVATAAYNTDLEAAKAEATGATSTDDSTADDSATTDPATEDAGQGEGNTTQPAGDTADTQDPDAETEENTCAVFKNPYSAGDLLVKKTVSGGGASQTKLFTFTVQLTYDGKPLEGKYPLFIDGVDTGKMVKKGIITFKLRHEQVATITGIPYGAKWTVEESMYQGYRTEYTNQRGTIKEPINTVEVDNHRDPESKIPKTGYGTITGDIIGAGSCAALFAASALLRSRTAKARKKKTDEDNNED